MRFQHILEKVFHRPWFISPGGYQAVKAVVEDAALDLPALAEMDLSDFIRTRSPLEIDSDGVATISILGTLGRHLTPIEESCGNTSYETIEAEIGEALASGATGIVFDIDSPGGMASGAGELAELVSEASGAVPTATYVGDLCASAAYYVASSTGAIIAEPSATVGSVGVIIPWCDSSAAFALEGLEFDPIVNDGADLKATMHGPSLTDEQRGYLQESVNDLASQFHSHVLAHRDVDPEVFRAGAYVGARAQNLGLVDWQGSLEDARRWVRDQRAPVS